MFLQDDEGFLNLSRITTILPIENSVWVGTGDGNLIMFDVIASIPGQNPDGLMSPEAEGLAVGFIFHISLMEKYSLL